MSKEPKEIAWMPQRIIDSFVNEANHKLPSETGGILWGYWNETNTEVVVKEIVGPGPEASHSRYAFIPDYDFHQEEIQKLYEQSERKEAYLGDWHSHPDGSCLLSFKDKRTLYTISSTPSARMPKPIMAIIAKKESWGIKIWFYSNISIFPFWLSWKQIKGMEVRIYK